MGDSAMPPEGEWKNISYAAHLKGRRRNPKYYPAIGQTCRMSGPNCEDADGYTWSEVEVLWSDEQFVVTRTPGCWPTVTKHELALFEPLDHHLVVEAREIAADAMAKTFKDVGADTLGRIRSGEDDNYACVAAALIALRRGIEIGSAK